MLLDTTIRSPSEELEIFTAGGEIIWYSISVDQRPCIGNKSAYYCVQGQVHGLSNLDMYALEIVPFLIFNTYKDEEGNPSIEKEFIQVSAGHGLSAAVSKGGDLFVWGTRIAYPPRQYTKKLFGGKKVIQVAVGGDSSK